MICPHASLDARTRSWKWEEDPNTIKQHHTGGANPNEDSRWMKLQSTHLTPPVTISSDEATGVIHLWRSRTTGGRSSSAQPSGPSPTHLPGWSLPMVKTMPTYIYIYMSFAHLLEIMYAQISTRTHTHAHTHTNIYIYINIYINIYIYIYIYK